MAADYCSDLVHKADRDRYLAALFAPEAKRPHVLALYAFNVELSRIREVVTEPRLGEIRLQWWRDTIEAIFADAVPDHPVAQGLAGAVETGDLTQLGFLNMIDARAFDLYDDPMPSLDVLEGYLGETASALVMMTGLVLAGRAAEDAADAAGHAGLAQGITGLMRMIAVHRARGQCFMPADVLARHDMTPAHVLAGRMSEGMRVVIRDLSGIAATHLAAARRLLGIVPPAALSAFLPVCLVDLYLKRLARSNRNIMTAVPEVQQMRRQWHMLKAALWKEF